MSKNEISHKVISPKPSKILIEDTEKSEISTRLNSYNINLQAY